MSTHYRPNQLDRRAIARGTRALMLATRNPKIPENKKDAMKKYTKIIIGWLCREMHHSADFASQAASQTAKEMGMTHEELLDMRWRDQPKRDPKRKKLHFEHMYPIAQAVSEIITMSHPTIQRIEAILAKIVVCWVTKEENKKLGGGKRPDPWKTYKDAKIVVLNRTGTRQTHSPIQRCREYRTAPIEPC